MTKEVVETPRLMFRQTTPPPVFRVEVSLLSIFVDLAVDLASGWRLLVRVLLDQGGLKLMVGVCRSVKDDLGSHDARTSDVEIYCPPSFSRR